VEGAVGRSGVVLSEVIISRREIFQSTLMLPHVAHFGRLITSEYYLAWRNWRCYLNSNDNHSYV